MFFIADEDGGGTCPSCHLGYDTGKRRVLVDSCGHQRCYTCIFSSDTCTQCQEAAAVTSRVGCQSPAMSVRSEASYGGVTRPGSALSSYGRVSAPHPGAVSSSRPRPLPSPSPGPAARRHNWIHRHTRHHRRPTTVNIDDSTMSGEAECNPSILASITTSLQSLLTCPYLLSTNLLLCPELCQLLAEFLAIIIYVLRLLNTTYSSYPCFLTCNYQIPSKVTTASHSYQ